MISTESIAGGIADPEMEARIGAGLEAPAADPEADAFSPRTRDRDPRPDGVAIRPGPFQAEADEMAATARSGCAENERLVLDDDDRVDAAVVVQSPTARPRPRCKRLEGRTRRAGNIGQMAAGTAQQDCRGMVQG